MHADGRLAKAPIAVCEAQGYLYAAWTGTARIAALLKLDCYARELEHKAQLLKSRFTQEFWLESKQYPALAIDGEGLKCEVISSNPGHLLSTGILSPKQELAVADRLMREDMFSGWGIRLWPAARSHISRWIISSAPSAPHDSGYSAAQMPRLGRAHHAHAIMQGLLDAAGHRTDQRLPELFCGLPRTGSAAPVRYPVACVPQAWAAGCWFHMLAGCMNIVVDAAANSITIKAASLPEWLGKVTVTGLRIADSELDLEFFPGKGRSSCRVTRLDGDIECIVA